MECSPAHPLVIQGGMGVGVSNWVLARAVALRGQLGVVSSAVLDTVFVRRLQDGDAGGHLRRALAQFPLPGVAQTILQRYFRPEGRPDGTPYAMLPMYKQAVSKARQQLTVAANFCEVWLAKEGHEGRVGINLLTKIQLPTLASLYGAMLAGVDYVLMGAGIPKEIPGVLDRLAQHLPASFRFDMEGLGRDEEEHLTFDPQAHRDDTPTSDLKRPFFLPIIASNSLATMLARKANGRVDGFVVEGATAGGHNAPPRGALTFDEQGEPIYGERDVVDLKQLHALGLPFWVAGGTGTPDSLRQALEDGAAGVQVGTLFAFSDESGLLPDHKAHVLACAADAPVRVKTDMRASPTGFPFKLVQLDDTLTDDTTYDARERVCDLGYLRTAYRTADGKMDFRCPAEPVEAFTQKGGDPTKTERCVCLCNALLAEIGLPQIRKDGIEEPPILTSGDDVRRLHTFAQGRTRYSAADVLDYLLSGLPGTPWAHRVPQAAVAV